MKLPFKMRDQWRSKLLQFKKQGRMETFNDLCEFVEEQAAKLNLVLYGNISDKKPANSAKKEYSTGTKKKAFSSSVEPKENKLACIVCKKTNHTIQRCFFFKKKKYENKGITCVTLV